MSTKRMSRARKDKSSQFEFDASVPDAAADQGFHYRESGRRAIPSTANVAPTKRRRVEVTDEPDPYVDWVDAPVDEGEFASIAKTLSSYNTYKHLIDEDEEVLKRKRYVSSDDPMKLWRAEKHIFLDHIVRHTGLGDYHDNPACSLCDAVYEPVSTTRIFRCEPCGQFLQCKACLKERHKLQPLHPIKEWTGEFWDDAALHRMHIGNQSSRSLQCEYQLGHHGAPCVRPASTDPQIMVVMDVHSVFTLQV
ncbi:hypothetical protein C8F01DRAFT_1255753 [Mycena amicta]|nr:hypothetical protein C8F01DRAFT_1255753 [Mycena amicta]